MIGSRINHIKEQIPDNVTLIAVSKTKPIELILEGISSGHLDFVENKVQELVSKHENLPKNIRWHMIGHLQRNKVKYIAPFVHMIHGVDSAKLLKEIDKQGQKNNRKINCLLQFHIASENTKFGFSLNEVETLQKEEFFNPLKHVNICGVMGMATFTDDNMVIRREFNNLKSYFEKLKNHFNTNDFEIISMGMSGDYPIAIECGSNMIRVGSAIFGERK
ncbi:MAG: YggS family pyridoxal phosphate-dependent enzyme [Bacteroidota bacterium]|nr:YggS family pyridoxal phosphate-dependent enzyme [Bacteroidota bacterium]